MADNYTFTEGTGTTAAADEISSVKYPRAKLIHGADGTNDGDVSTTNPLPVEVTDNNNTVAADTASIKTAVEIIDNAIGTTGAVAGATDGGIPPLAIRDDTLTTLSDPEGDYVPMRVNSTGALHVTGSAGSTQYTEDTAHTTGDTGTMVFGVRNDTGATLVSADGDYTALQTDADGNLRVMLSDGGEDAVISTAAADALANATNGLVTYGLSHVFNGTTWDRLRGDTSGLHVSQIIPGTSATHLGKAIGSVAGATDTGVAPLAIRDDTLTTLSDPEGDYIPLRVNSTGALHVTGSAGSTQYSEDDAHTTADTGTMVLAVRNDDLATLCDTDGDYAPLQVTENGGLYIEGAAVDNEAVAGKPVCMAGVYNSSADTYDDGDAARLQTDVNGNLYVSLKTVLANVGAGGAEQDTIGVSPTYRTDAFNSTITSADATSATQIKAKTASKKIYITDVIISVDTAMNVQLQDDAGTPAVAMEQIYLPANSVFSKTFSTPLVLATNQDLDVITSAAGNISVTVSGYII